MSSRDTFFINDSPQMVFESRLPNPHRFDDPDGLPGNPTDIEVRFFDSMGANMVLIGPDSKEFLTQDDEYITLVPMSPDEHRGALIYIVIPPEVMAVAGRYTLYIRTIFEDGMSITEDHKVDVSEYR